MYNTIRWLLLLPIKSLQIHNACIGANMNDVTASQKAVAKKQSKQKWCYCTSKTIAKNQKCKSCAHTHTLLNFSFYWQEWHTNMYPASQRYSLISLSTSKLTMFQNANLFRSLINPHLNPQDFDNNMNLNCDSWLLLSWEIVGIWRGFQSYKSNK